MSGELFLDIETLPTNESEIRDKIAKEEAERTPPVSWTKAKKEAFFEEGALEARLEEALCKTAVDPLLARVCVICAHSAGEYLHWTSEQGERRMLQAFAEAMMDMTDRRTIWVGHNCIGFDLPIIANRMRRLDVTPPSSFPLCSGGRAYGRVFDTMLRAGAKTPYVSLESACEAYGIQMRGVEWQGRDMEGSRVYSAWCAGEWDLLLDYCLADVEATVRLYTTLTHRGQWGTYQDDDELLDELEAIERNPDLTAGQRAMAIVASLRNADYYPRRSKR